MIEGKILQTNQKPISIIDINKNTFFFAFLFNHKLCDHMRHIQEGKYRIFKSLFVVKYYNIVPSLDIMVVFEWLLSLQVKDTKK